MSRFIACLTLFGVVATLCLLVTAPAQATHPRPKSASPLTASLVPAYEQCIAPNRTHGPPLAFPSCNPPARTSAQATVGTPDAFGGAANSAGYLRLRQWESIPGGPYEADILIDSVVNDVRCMPTGTRCGNANDSGPADYTGATRLSFTWRLTDHWNATAPGGGLDPATVEDFATEFSVACAQSGSTSAGSTCSTNTTMESLVPGAVPELKRAIWELNAFRFYDGGADGDGDTTADNTVFMRPGVFIP